jgi:hypothetical protein
MMDWLLFLLGYAAGLVSFAVALVVGSLLSDKVQQHQNDRELADHVRREYYR